MSNRRKPIVAVLTVVAALLGTWFAALSSASADICTVTITVVGGQTYTFDNIDVPPNTPISAMGLQVPGPVASESESCQPATTSASMSSDAATSSSSSTSTTSSSSSSTSSSPSSTSTSTSPSSSSSSSTSSTTTTNSTSSSPAGGRGPIGKGKGEKRSSHPQATPQPTPASKAKHKNHKKKTAPQAGSPNVTPLNGKGVPSPANPTFSFSLPGPAPLGVPNFFIDSFRIPPFLIPIYQAAGIEYQVPWQVLAAINEIETDYGRNLSVSSAGAVGWMQFLPSTWKHWGVDANGDGVADPYNPVDAIFSAARYLHAAGASSNVGRAVFAYNHADWYVQSVLLRAKLIGGIPSGLVGALAGLVSGHFPVAAAAKYADDNIVSLAGKKVRGANAAIAVDSNPATKGTSIFARRGAPVIAVNDGRIVKIGSSPELGNYIELQDATGNIYTYAHLGTLSKLYPVPKPARITSRQIVKEFSIPAAKAPSAPASAGSQSTSGPAAAPAKSRAAVPAKAARIPAPAAPAAPTAASPTQTQTQSVSVPMVKERLFAHPSRPASYASGGDLQIKATQEIANFRDYFSDTLHLAPNQYTLQPLRAGSIVIAGTILGRIGGPSQGVAPHLYFMVQPAGRNAPYIDPKPILDGWKLLEATAVYRADRVDPFFGPGAKNPTIGQVLLMSKDELTSRVLADPHVQIYPCGRRDIEAGLIDRRVLATIEFLSVSGLDPYVSGLSCGHSLTGSTGVDAAGATGSSLDISKINGIPVLGHQGAGSITDITVRRLLTLQGAMRPDQIISDMSYKDQAATLALPDHKNRIQITFTPDYGANKKLSNQIKSILQPGQWIQLINRISQIPEPVVPIAPSRYAIRTH